MKWSRKSDYVMAGEHGYKVAKFIDDGRASYRASRYREFIGQPQDSFDEAAQTCDANYQAMGDIAPPRKTS